MSKKGSTKSPRPGGSVISESMVGTLGFDINKASKKPRRTSVAHDALEDAYLPNDTNTFKDSKKFIDLRAAQSTDDVKPPPIKYKTGYLSKFPALLACVPCNSFHSKVIQRDLKGVIEEYNDQTDVTKNREELIEEHLKNLQIVGYRRPERGSLAAIRKMHDLARSKKTVLLTMEQHRKNAGLRVTVPKLRTKNRGNRGAGFNKKRKGAMVDKDAFVLPSDLELRVAEASTSFGDFVILGRDLTPNVLSDLVNSEPVRKAASKRKMSGASPKGFLSKAFDIKRWFRGGRSSVCSTGACSLRPSNSTSRVFIERRVNDSSADLTEGSRRKGYTTPSPASSFTSSQSGTSKSPQNIVVIAKDGRVRPSGSSTSLSDDGEASRKTSDVDWFGLSKKNSLISGIHQRTASLISGLSTAIKPEPPVKEPRISMQSEGSNVDFVNLSIKRNLNKSVRGLSAKVTAVFEKDWKTTERRVDEFMTKLRKYNLANVARHTKERWMVVLYTSSDVTLDPFSEFSCLYARALFQKHRVVYDERDIGAFQMYKHELKHRLKGTGDDLSVPCIFVAGMKVGDGRALYAINKKALMEQAFSQFVIGNDVMYDHWLYKPPNMYAVVLDLNVPLNEYPSVKCISEGGVIKLDRQEMACVQEGKNVVNSAKQKWEMSTALEFSDWDYWKFCVLTNQLRQCFLVMDMIFWKRMFPTTAYQQNDWQHMQRCIDIMKLTKKV